MEVRCPTCGGSGKVLWTPPPNSGPMCISPWPTETCRTCDGNGWMLDAAESKRLDEAFHALMIFEPEPE